MELSGTFFSIIKVPVPTLTLSPILHFPKTVVFGPRTTPSPIVGKSKRFPPTVQF